MGDPAVPAANLSRLPVHAFRIGGAAGMVGALWVAAQVFGGFYGPAASAAGFIPPLAAIIVGMMRWRDRGTGGTTTFTASFRAGLFIGLVYALVVALAAWACATARLDLVIEQVARVYTGVLQQQGVAEDEIPRLVDNLRHSLTPVAFAKPFLATSLLVSLVVSLIAAIIIPRQKI